jgi:hypothetical protein
VAGTRADRVCYRSGPGPWPAVNPTMTATRDSNRAPKLDWYVQGTYDDIPQHDISGPHAHYQLALAWLEALLWSRTPPDQESLKSPGPQVQVDETGRQVAWTYRTAGGKFVYYRLRSEPRRRRAVPPPPAPPEVEEEEEEEPALAVASRREATPAPTAPAAPAARLKAPRRLFPQLPLAELGEPAAPAAPAAVQPDREAKGEA